MRTCITFLPLLLMGVLPSAETPARPNVLLIAVDDLNDWVGCLGGHPQAVTPHMDRLARRGVVFANAHCQAPLCNPSRASVFTGLRPTTTGIYALEPSFRAAPATRDTVTLPRHFAAQGWHTATCGKIYHDCKDVGRILQEDFQIVGPRPGQKSQRPRLAPALSEHPAVDWGVVPGDGRDHADHIVTDAAIAQLQAAPADRPFFIAAGLRLPHVPCYAPQACFDRIPVEVTLPPLRDDDRADIPDFAWYLHWRLPEPRLAALRKADQWRPLVRAYLASTAFMDHQVGRLLDALDADPRGKDTIVVLWSDNGWHLGEKGITGKNSLWDRSTRVPLIIAGPGVAPGGVCRQPAELLDIYPTLVEVCHLPARPGLEGHSLAPQLADPAAARPWPAITTANRGNHGIRTECWRYIRYADGSEELYDHATDPHEWTNVAKDAGRADVIRDLARWLPGNEAAPAPGSRSRLLIREGDRWLWEGEPIAPGESVPGGVTP